MDIGFTKDTLENIGRELLDLHRGILSLNSTLSVPAVIEQSKELLALGYTPESLGFGPLLKWQEVLAIYKRDFTFPSSSGDGHEQDTVHLLRLFLADEPRLSEINLKATAAGADIVHPVLSDLMIRIRNIIDKCQNNTQIMEKAIQSYLTKAWSND